MRQVLVGFVLVIGIGTLSGCGGKEAASERRAPQPTVVAAPEQSSEPTQPAPDVSTGKDPVAPPSPDMTSAEAPPAATAPAAPAITPIPAENLPPGIKADSAEALSLAKLKFIAEGFAAYHEKQSHFPPAASYQGETPLLSWRVALLPYLGQEELYKQFKLQEPWDSAANKPLAAKIPEVYRTPGRAADEKTCYVVGAGVGTIFGQRDGMAEGQIRDGKDKTLLVMETDAEQAVTWTQPEDLHYFPAQPLTGLGKLRDGVFLAAFADGAVRALPVSLDQANFRALFSANGGEPLDMAALDATIAQSRETPGAAGKNVPPPSPANKAQADAVGMLVKGNVKRGLSLLLAEAARGNEDVLKSMRWSPALRRPMFILRCGVATQAPGVVAISEVPPRNPRKPQIIPPLPQPTIDSVTYWAGEFGKPFMDKMQAHMRDGKFGEWLKQAARPADAPPPAEPAPDDKKPRGPKYAYEGGILNMSLMEAEQAHRIAQKEGIDVLLSLKITTHMVRGAKNEFHPQSNAAISVRDLLKDEEAWNSHLVASPILGTAAAPAGETSMAGKRLLDEVLEFVEAQLLLTDMPKLTPQTAQRRAAVIAQRAADPLPILAELRYYQVLKLLTPEQLSEYYGKVIGADLGTQLATGNEAVRQQAIDKLLGMDRGE